MSPSVLFDTMVSVLHEIGRETACQRGWVESDSNKNTGMGCIRIFRI